MKPGLKKFSRGFIGIKVPLILILVLIPALGFVWQRAYTMSLARRITNLENRLLELRSNNAKKVVLLSELSAPERIESIVMERCDLKFSMPGECLRVCQNEDIAPLRQSNLQKSVYSIKDFFVQQWEKYVSAPVEKELELHQSNL